jgi:oligopeptide/dipeptide ABC transporter ATP-binding protein
MVQGDLLHVENLTTDFSTAGGVVRAVDGVSFSIPSGKVVALVGASGSGKTVTALSTLRLIREPGRIVAGRVLYRGRDILRMADGELRTVRGGKIATVFQDPLTSLHPAMRICDQIVESIRAHLPVDRHAAAARAIDLLRRVGMPEPALRSREYPHELSSGLRQRAMLAIALAAGPELLIADEPTSYLDATLQAEMLGMFAQLRREQGLAMLLITHDLALAAEIADEVLVMAAGRIAESGSPAELFQHPGQPATTQLVASIRAIEEPGPVHVETAPRLLELRAVSKRFSPAGTAVRGVDEVSLQVGAGETLALVGESGSGKTTLGRIAVGLLRPSSGSVSFDGNEITSLGGRALRRIRRDLQMIFPDAAAALDPRQRIAAAISEPLEVHGMLAPGEQRRNRVLELLEQVGLASALADRFPHQLSGGQRQRVVIARALATNPTLIVADEPLSAVDVTLQAQIVELLAGLRRARGLTFLLVAHDLRVVRRLAMRVAVMHAGRIVEVSRADDLYRDPLHPCTRALVAAMPRFERRERIALPRAAPPEIAGCSFRSRCPVPDKPGTCSSERPALREVAPGRFVACHVA